VDEAGSRRYHISAGWLLSIEVTGMGGLVGHVSVGQTVLLRFSLSLCLAFSWRLSIGRVRCRCSGRRCVYEKKAVLKLGFDQMSNF